jgi:hypothetical protein
MAISYKEQFPSPKILVGAEMANNIDNVTEVNQEVTQRYFA